MSLRAILEERLALMAPARRLRLALAERELAARLGAESRSRILDAGCGDGLLALAIAKRHPTWALVGVDLNEELLDGARKRAAARGLPNARFVPGNLEQPLPEEGRDAVTAVECLSEIPDDRQALRMMCGALRPGGLLVVQVPERGWKPVLPGSADTWRAEVRHGYSAEQLRAYLEEAGFAEVEIQPTYRSLAAAAQEVRDRIKGRGLLVRLLAFPFLAAAVRLERGGLTWGRANALLATARRRPAAGS